MNCVPILDRELRVAARKRSTPWMRVAAALTGLLLGFGCLITCGWQGIGTTEMGSVLFYALTWTCLVAVLSAGLFFTSDCLSEEKREGTLGLLFLTELRGYDVALGKLTATSLRGFYALLAVLPILAVTELMGGITGAQYWKSSLALVNALFVSLATGLLISAFSRDSQKAMMATLLVLLLLSLGGPVFDELLGAARHRNFGPFGALLSPGYVLLSASAWGRSDFWKALLSTHLAGWLMLGLACVVVPRAWQEKRRGSKSKVGWGFAWKFGGKARRARLRRKLLALQPVTWLLCRERWQSLGFWSAAGLVLCLFVSLLIWSQPMGTWMVWGWFGGLFTLVLYLFACSQACRFFAEGRRSGLLELLLVTPVTERQVVSSQWRALRRMFGVPLLLLLAVQISGAVLSQLSMQRMMRQAGAVTATTTTFTNQNGAVVSNQTFVSSVAVSGGSSSTNAAAPGGAPVPGRLAVAELAASLISGLANALCTIGNLLALVWFGMWMGLTSRSANLATLKTLLFVQIIPVVVIAFSSIMMTSIVLAPLLSRMTSAPSGSWFAWWQLLGALLGTLLALGKDAGFIIWARARLRSSFRAQVSGTPGDRRAVAPPVLK